MPRFTIRLEDPDSDEFRETSGVFDDKDAAQAWCEDRERKLVAFTIDAKRLAKLEAKADELRGTDKAHLVIHNQTVPYEVVSVTETPARKEK
jgi:hypothetical protein